ncbi:MAG TPA: glycosyltransferase [Afipia sp.]
MALSDGLATQTNDFVTRPRRALAFCRRLPGLVGSLLRTPVRPAAPAPSPADGHPYELDCLRGVLAEEVLDAAAQRSRKVGIGADQVLIRWGKVREDVYLDHLAAYGGMEREHFESIERSDCPLSDDHIRFAALHRILPIYKNGELVYVKVPEGYAARRVSELSVKYNGVAKRIHLATRDAFDGFLVAHAGATLARPAADDLKDRLPHLSTAPRARARLSPLSFLSRVLAIALPLIIAPVLVIQICGAMLAVWFLSFTCLRLAGSFAPRPRAKRFARLPDDQLPIYTVIVALYREARSVASLMRSLDALDYPREKLDIKLVLEPDDMETRAAIASLGLLPHVQIVTAPDYGPRTKPKALNYALAMARGTFLAVFDAEDRPDPTQLRDALHMFRDARVACAQASLCIDNTSDGWLPRMFTAEYAGQFDVFLQGFSAFDMPLPLGGSSNHFRTATLREVGGWDAYNVTEDADLGFRLARFGYRSTMFASTTYEEAPAKFGAWLRQRSRWMKGWMQTWIVHMRSPTGLWRDAGARGFFTLNIIVGGNVLTALAHPVMLAEVLIQTIMQAFDSNISSFLASNFAELHVAAIAAGYFSTVVIGLIGLARRRLLHEAWILLLTPIYWICLSIAAWRALYQFMTDPYRWEKTEHGLARHSRLAARTHQR